LQEINYVEILKISVPILVVILVLGIALYFIQKSREKTGEKDKNDLDPEKLRLEMEALAKEKLARRKAGEVVAYKTDAPPEVVASTSSESADEDFIEGEPLA